MHIPLSTSIASLLFAPDIDGAPAGGAAIAVPASASPTGSAIEVTPQAAPAPPEIFQPAEAKAKPVRQRGVEMSAAKTLGLDSSPAEKIAQEAKAFRERDKKGKFAPNKTPKQKAIEEPKAAPDPVVKLGEPKPVTPAPTPVTKVKIGDTEMTPEEIQARIKELEAKAAKPPELPKPAEPAKVDPPPDAAAIAADLKKRQDEFLEKADAVNTIPQDIWDKLINADPEGLSAITRHFSEMEMRMAERAAAFVNQAIERFDGIDGRLNPILERETLMQQYQTEQQFLNSNPEISSHAEGLKSMREISQELHAEHDDILALLSASPNSSNAARYQARAKALEENFIAELAKTTKLRLGIGLAPIVPPAAAAPIPIPVAEPPKPRPVAPSGQMSTAGGSRAAKAMDDQKAQVQELIRSGKF